MRRFVPLIGLVALAIAQDRPTFRVKVDMVVLSFQVQDSKNHYINGLKHSDFRIYEDGILQRVSTFAEGSSVSGLRQPMTSIRVDAARHQGRNGGCIGADPRRSKQMRTTVTPPEPPEPD